MRSEQEMLDLILNTARNDERIRAVVMNGSRTTATHRDPFQDFDIAYLVTDPALFREDPRWIDCFGERMILQMPEDMDHPELGPHEAFSYLMQFTDGNRIDLWLYPLEQYDDLRNDSQSVLLLDKNGTLAPFPPPSDSSYLPQPPSPVQFFNCCNEFWWVNPYAAKGLWRAQIVYAKTMLDNILRTQLEKMVIWHIGVQTGFQANPGGFGKDIPRFLEPELWELCLKTYADADIERCWQALFAMGDLFRICARSVADQLGYEYPSGEDARITAYLQHVRSLPGDAQQIY